MGAGLSLPLLDFWLLAPFKTDMVGLLSGFTLLDALPPVHASWVPGFMPNFPLHAKPFPLMSRYLKAINES